MSNPHRRPQCVEPHIEWMRLRYADRALGADLLRVFGDAGEIDVSLGALGDVVCRRLAVDGRDRPSVRRSLERLFAIGVIVEDQPKLRLLYSDEAYRAWWASRGVE